MFVGVLRFRLEIAGARSLKDKRSVVRSLKERVQGRLKVAIAEIGSLDDPRRATFGVACVSNDASVCDQMLASVTSMASVLPDAILADQATEIIPFGEGGRGVEGGIEQALGRLHTPGEGDGDDDDFAPADLDPQAHAGALERERERDRDRARHHDDDDDEEKR